MEIQLANWRIANPLEEAQGLFEGLDVRELLDVRLVKKLLQPLEPLGFEGLDEVRCRPDEPWKR